MGIGANFTANILSLTVELGSIVLLVVLIFALLSEIRFKEGASSYLMDCLIALAISILIDAPKWIMVGYPENIILIMFLSVLSYIALMVSLVYFTIYLVKHLNEKVFVSYSVCTFSGIWGTICSIIYLVMLISNSLFVFDENGYFTYAKYYPIVELLPLFMMILNIALIYSCRRSLTRKYYITWLSFMVLPLVGMAVEAFVKCSLSYFMFAISALLIYVNIHTEQNIIIASQEAELTESRMKVMISQIQPHFMYNTLNSIYYLIEKDPNRAQNMLSTFSDYLRLNINALSAEKPIDFSQEMKHITSYLNLEKVRFEDELEIEYDIKDEDFTVPSFSIQTLVENAVKHGISQKDGGGKIKISTYMDQEYHYISIKDNGVGMNIKEYEKKLENNKSGIGIKTSKERIEKQCSGTVEIYSIIGKGTEVVIKLPRELRH